MKMHLYRPPLSRTASYACCPLVAVSKSWPSFLMWWLIILRFTGLSSTRRKVAGNVGGSLELPCSANGGVGVAAGPSSGASRTGRSNVVASFSVVCVSSSGSSGSEPGTSAGLSPNSVGVSGGGDITAFVGGISGVPNAPCTDASLVPPDSVEELTLPEWELVHLRKLNRRIFASFRGPILCRAG